MINVKDAKCSYNGGCSSRPTYNIDGQKALYCVKHKTSEMIDVANKRCARNGCKIRPNYNTKGETSGLYCVKHKQKGMIDIRRNKCKYPGCKIQPSYNIPGQIKGIYCVNHKSDNMIDVKNKRCIIDGCKSRRNYNIKGNPGLYCGKHKLPGMINVNNKTCKHQDCGKQPTFNTEGEKTPLYCADHKKKGMVDVKNKRCAYTGCKKRPNYNFENELKGLYCIAHKKVNMVDVVHTKCIYPKCKSRSEYGTALTGRIHCTTHTDKGKEWKLTACKHNNCRNIAIYSKNGVKPYQYCMYHNPDDYKSQITGKCSSCGLDDLLLDEQGKCIIACTETQKYRMKYSEEEMNKSFHNAKFKYVRDCAVEGGCDRKRRPDFVFDLGAGIIIVENDENQHRSRPCECEQTRMIQIHNEYGGLPVHFIRFNPDRYKASETKEDTILLDRRLNKLVEIMKTHIKTATEFFERNDGLTVTYLYYDGHVNNEYKIIPIQYL